MPGARWRLRHNTAQLRIGESRDSGFDASHRPGMTKNYPTSLPVPIHRPSLLDERRHAFGAIFQRDGGMKQFTLDVEAFGKRRLERAVDGALRHLVRGARHRG